MLVNDKSSSVMLSPASSEECNIPDATAVHIVQLIMPALYLGYFERVIFLGKKFESLHEHSKARMPMRIILVSFYYGLAMVESYRRRRSQKVLPIVEKAISVLKKASELSSWNFKNKLLLLEAEKLSSGNKTKEQKKTVGPKYDMAIEACKSSKFIHDEALACELAGNHFVGNKNVKKALCLYEQAEKCYREWGTEKKATQMRELIKSLS